MGSETVSGRTGSRLWLSLVGARPFLPSFASEHVTVYSGHTVHSIVYSKRAVVCGTATERYDRFSVRTSSVGKVLGSFNVPEWQCLVMMTYSPF